MATPELKITEAYLRGRLIEAHLTLLTSTKRDGTLVVSPEVLAQREAAVLAAKEKLEAYRHSKGVV